MGVDDLPEPLRSILKQWAGRAGIQLDLDALDPGFFQWLLDEIERIRGLQQQERDNWAGPDYYFTEGQIAARLRAETPDMWAPQFGSAPRPVPRQEEGLAPGWFQHPDVAEIIALALQPVDRQLAFLESAGMPVPVIGETAGLTVQEVLDKITEQFLNNEATQKILERRQADLDRFHDFHRRMAEWIVGGQLDLNDDIAPFLRLSPTTPYHDYGVGGHMTPWGFAQDALPELWETDAEQAALQAVVDMYREALEETLAAEPGSEEFSDNVEWMDEQRQALADAGHDPDLLLGARFDPRSVEPYTPEQLDELQRTVVGAIESYLVETVGKSYADLQKWERDTVVQWVNDVMDVYVNRNAGGVPVTPKYRAIIGGVGHQGLNYMRQHVESVQHAASEAGGAPFERQPRFGIPGTEPFGPQDPAEWAGWWYGPDSPLAAIRERAGLPRAGKPVPVRARDIEHLLDPKRSWERWPEPLGDAFVSAADLFMALDELMGTPMGFRRHMRGYLHERGQQAEPSLAELDDDQLVEAWDEFKRMVAARPPPEDLELLWLQSRAAFAAMPEPLQRAVRGTAFIFSGDLDALSPSLYRTLTGLYRELGPLTGQKPEGWDEDLYERVLEVVGYDSFGLNFEGRVDAARALYDGEFAVHSWLHHPDMVDLLSEARTKSHWTDFLPYGQRRALWRITRFMSDGGTSVGEVFRDTLRSELLGLKGSKQNSRVGDEANRDYGYLIEALERFPGFPVGVIRHIEDWWDLIPLNREASGDQWNIMEAKWYELWTNDSLTDSLIDWDDLPSELEEALRVAMSRVDDSLFASEDVDKLVDHVQAKAVESDGDATRAELLRDLWGSDGEPTDAQWLEYTRGGLTASFASDASTQLDADLSHLEDKISWRKHRRGEVAKKLPDEVMGFVEHEAALLGVNLNDLHSGFFDKLDELVLENLQRSRDFEERDIRYRVGQDSAVINFYGEHSDTFTGTRGYHPNTWFHHQNIRRIVNDAADAVRAGGAENEYQVRRHLLRYVNAPVLVDELIRQFRQLGDPEAVFGQLAELGDGELIADEIRHGDFEPLWHDAQLEAIDPRAVKAPEPRGDSLEDAVRQAGWRLLADEVGLSVVRTDRWLDYMDDDFERFVAAVRDGAIHDIGDIYHAMGFTTAFHESPGTTHESLYDHFAAVVAEHGKEHGWTDAHRAFTDGRIRAEIFVPNMEQFFELLSDEMRELVFAEGQTAQYFWEVADANPEQFEEVLDEYPSAGRGRGDGPSETLDAYYKWAEDNKGAHEEAYAIHKDDPMMVRRFVQDNKEMFEPYLNPEVGEVPGQQELLFPPPEETLGTYYAWAEDNVEAHSEAHAAHDGDPALIGRFVQDNEDMFEPYREAGRRVFAKHYENFFLRERRESFERVIREGTLFDADPYDESDGFQHESSRTVWDPLLERWRHPTNEERGIGVGVGSDPPLPFPYPEGPFPLDDYLLGGLNQLLEDMDEVVAEADRENAEDVAEGRMVRSTELGPRDTPIPRYTLTELREQYLRGEHGGVGHHMMWYGAYDESTGLLYKWGPKGDHSHKELYTVSPLPEPYAAPAREWKVRDDYPYEQVAVSQGLMGIGAPTSQMPDPPDDYFEGVPEGHVALFRGSSESDRIPQGGWFAVNPEYAREYAWGNQMTTGLSGPDSPGWGEDRWLRRYDVPEGIVREEGWDAAWGKEVEGFRMFPDAWVADRLEELARAEAYPSAGPESVPELSDGQRIAAESLGMTEEAMLELSPDQRIAAESLALLREAMLDGEWFRSLPEAEQDQMWKDMEGLERRLAGESWDQIGPGEEFEQLIRRGEVPAEPLPEGFELTDEQEAALRQFEQGLRDAVEAPFESLDVSKAARDKLTQLNRWLHDSGIPTQSQLDSRREERERAADPDNLSVRERESIERRLADDDPAVVAEARQDLRFAQDESTYVDSPEQRLGDLVLGGDTQFDNEFERNPEVRKDLEQVDEFYSVVDGEHAADEARMTAWAAEQGISPTDDALLHEWFSSRDNATYTYSEIWDMYRAMGGEPLPESFWPDTVPAASSLLDPLGGVRQDVGTQSARHAAAEWARLAGRYGYAGFERIEGALNPLEEMVEEGVLRGVSRFGQALQGRGAGMAGAAGRAIRGTGRVASFLPKVAGPASVAGLGAMFGWHLSQGQSVAEAAKNTVGDLGGTQLYQLTDLDSRAELARDYVDTVRGGGDGVGGFFKGLWDAAGGMYSSLFGFGEEDPPPVRSAAGRHRTRTQEPVPSSSANHAAATPSVQRPATGGFHTPAFASSYRTPTPRTVDPTSFYTPAFAGSVQALRDAETEEWKRRSVGNAFANLAVGGYNRDLERRRVDAVERFMGW